MSKPDKSGSGPCNDFAPFIGGTGDVVCGECGWSYEEHSHKILPRICKCCAGPCRYPAVPIDPVDGRHYFGG